MPTSTRSEASRRGSRASLADECILPEEAAGSKDCTAGQIADRFVVSFERVEEA
ncbi:hypothetical protein ACFQDD_02550 [Halorubrum pallidum]|uniref:Uncharacterized protein n=1 Tax=Halorubrum pallidum TaxID=1526114 RepID=A0ABD5T0Z2_9EURY